MKPNSYLHLIINPLISKYKYILILYIIVQLVFILFFPREYTNDAEYYYSLAKECVQNNELDVIPVNYSKDKSIEWERRNFPFNFYFILDVDNPLSGKDGTVRVFAKQKGADENTIEILERGFDNVLNLLQNNKLYTSSNILSGAGGGIPSGFNILFNSSNIPAREFILTNLDLRKQIELA
ncbi:MAG: glycerate kinase, partial [bacterium]